MQVEDTARTLLGAELTRALALAVLAALVVGVRAVDGLGLLGAYALYCGVAALLTTVALVATAVVHRRPVLA